MPNRTFIDFLYCWQSYAWRLIGLATAWTVRLRESGDSNGLGTDSTSITWSISSGLWR